MASSLLVMLALITAASDSVPTVQPNDNRHAAGTVRDSVLRVDLEARFGAWRPDAEVDSTVTVRAFAERGKALQTPGPLIRARQGSRIHVTFHNLFADSALVIHGLRAGTVGDDTIHVAPGAVREIEFTADSAGTFLYWATTTDGPIGVRVGRSTQLNGVIVIDAAGAPVDAAERIFVLTLIDILPDSSRPAPREDVWEVAVNGRSWPGTERMTYAVGDSVHWRWVNATDRVHPMHLHGFHFRVTAKGNGSADTAYSAATQRLGVTELMLPGSTFAMAWVPTRAGNWLMHCHMIPHITPFPERPDTVRNHDSHDVLQHPLSAMAGLVLGITVTDSAGRGAAKPVRAVRTLRLLAQESHPADTTTRPARGYVLQNGAEPARDSVNVPGTPLILRRNETVQITVVNNLSLPTTVHWHGMELESVFDGVSGWSGWNASRAPLVAPGDSFAVVFTPPRAGTYMYHTHMDEGDQLAAGMYGPMIVLDSAETWSDDRNIIEMVGSVVDGKSFRPGLNGTHTPPVRDLTAGVTYRFRIINMHAVLPVMVSLVTGDSAMQWTRVSKDGAALPPSLVSSVTARLRVGVGETYDFEWTPEAGQPEAQFRVDFPVREKLPPLVQRLRLR